MEDGYASGASCESHDSSSADKEKTLKKRTTSTSIKKWNERTLLIDLLQERPSFWDMFDSEYTKREVREVAYKEIAEKLEENWTLSEITSRTMKPIKASSAMSQEKNDNME